VSTIFTPAHNSSIYGGLTTISGTCDATVTTLTITGTGFTPSPTTIPCAGGTYSTVVTITAGGTITTSQTDAAGNTASANSTYTLTSVGGSSGSTGGSSTWTPTTTQATTVKPTTTVSTTPTTPAEVKALAKPQCFINYSRLIKRGMRGNDVKQAQVCMTSLGHDSGPFDGLYGKLTYAGIISYQTTNKLLIDGIIGPETAGHLNALSGVKLDGVTPLK